MDYQFLSRTALFQGSEPEQVKEMMKCFYARERHYRKGEIVLYMGDLVKDLGLVLSGGVTIERDDLLGNRSIFGHAGPGQIFAETYACHPGEPLMVNVVADEDTDISGYRTGADYLPEHLYPPQHADPEPAAGIGPQKSRSFRAYHAHIAKIHPRTADLLLFSPGGQTGEPALFYPQRNLEK